MVWFQALLSNKTAFTTVPKSFGNIVTFRDLEQDTIDAITLFGKSNTRNVVFGKKLPRIYERLLPMQVSPVADI